MDGFYEYAFAPTRLLTYVPFIVLEVAGCVCVLSILAKAWSRRRRLTERQLDDASQLVLLPAYITMLRLYTVTSLFQAATSITTDPFQAFDMNIVDAGVMVAVAQASNAAVLHGLALFLLQRGAGTLSLRQIVAPAAVGGLVTLAVYVGPIAVAVFYWDAWLDASTYSFWCAVLLATWQWLLAACYGVVWLLPAKKLYRRPAALGYARFWTTTRFCLGLSFLLHALQERGHILGDTAFMKTVVVVAMTFSKGLLYSCGGPIFVHAAMQEDSAFWQGHHLGQAGRAHSELVAPLAGLTYSGSNAAQLVDAVEQAVRQSRVRLLNFASLHLQAETVLGVGGQARVYVGSWRRLKVAVKVVFCVDLTPQIIEEFCSEAAFLTSLAHPNIVAVHGICVVPPTLGIVLELCELGSLASVLSSSDGAPNRLTWRDKLRLSCDCAQAIMYLHSRNIAHRDIKSGNFLITKAMTAKLADLGLAQAVAPVVAAAQPRPSVARASRAAMMHSARQIPATAGSNRNLFAVTTRFAAASPPPSSSSTGSVASSTAATSGFSGTVAWAAPEVLRGESHTPAADVYSLGIVLWEIVAQRLPFSAGPAAKLSLHDLQHAIVGFADWQQYREAPVTTFETVVAGLRPSLPANIPERLSQLICRAWSHEPSVRPSAPELLVVLQQLLQPHAIWTTVHTPAWPAPGTQQLLVMNPLLASSGTV